MKHLLRGLWIVALILCCNFQQVFAQQMPPIPVDKNVRIGKLDNGLTYYIRKNSQPANRADFYIAQKVGSIQEEADQRGLAHFLEHMCFNGTTHFPGDALKQYLERNRIQHFQCAGHYSGSHRLLLADSARLE